MKSSTSRISGSAPAKNQIPFAQFPFTQSQECRTMAATHIFAAVDVSMERTYNEVVSAAESFLAAPTYEAAHLMIAYGDMMEAIGKADMARQYNLLEGFHFLHSPHLHLVKEAVAAAKILAPV
jgi:hypothetical protein